MNKKVLFSVALLALTLVAGSVVALGADFDVISGSQGAVDYHWWEDVLWKADVDMKGKKIEIKHVDTYLLIDYIRFVNLTTGDEVVFFDWMSAKPADALIEVYDIKTFTKDSKTWAVRTDHMGGVGGMSLHAMVGQTLPNLVIDPGLEGRYAIYVGTRATDFANQAGLRITE